MLTGGSSSPPADCWYESWGGDPWGGDPWGGGFSSDWETSCCLCGNNLIYNWIIT